MSGSVRSLVRYPEKKQPGVEEQRLYFIKDTGIQGDFHADGSNNQVSILTLEAKKWMADQEVKGHCFLRFKENILVDGICLVECEPGDQLICGDAVLKFSDFIKRCHPDICSLAGTDIPCILADHIRYAVVETSGAVQIGMEVLIKKKERN